MDAMTDRIEGHSVFHRGDCLRPLTPHIGVWWCDGCERDVQVET